MTDMYALVVRLDSYEYEGEFYFIGEEYGTPSDVLQYVAADHIMAIERTHHIEQYLLDVLKTGENVSESTYEGVNTDVECGINVDVYYQRFSFWTGDHVVEIPTQPTKSELESIAADLRSDDAAE
ncbi:hypothetical protein [Haladaptatus sp. NG-WS-4]